jgi:hypothetical protein
VHPSIAIKADYSLSTQEVLHRVLVNTITQRDSSNMTLFCETFELTREHVGRALELRTWDAMNHDIRHRLLKKFFADEERELISSKHEASTETTVLEKLQSWIHSEPLSRLEPLSDWYARHNHAKVLLFKVVLWTNYGINWQNRMIDFLYDQYMNRKREDAADKGLSRWEQSSWEQSTANFFKELSLFHGR